MSFPRHRLLHAILVVILGMGAGSGATSALADSGRAAGKAGTPASSALQPAEAGKARVAKGVIVAHAASTRSAAEWAGLRPHYDELKPRIHTNTD